ncbi:MAG: RNA polymerase sigma factor [Planctomycetota bacterium]|jgi:RNA polymerase sigma-70 factor (ECF subfamily)
MEQNNISNAILVLKCQRRDEKAFREIVNSWEPRLYYYLRRIVENENDVWDILQETWLAVFQNIRNLQDPLKFSTWLYRIGHNKAVNLLRKKNKYTQITTEHTANHYENNATISVIKEQAELVHELLGKLKLAHREVITLYFLEEFSINEMAQIIGISEGTVKSRLYYAKHKLHEMLKGAKDV